MSGYGRTHLGCEQVAVPALSAFTGTLMRAQIVAQHRERLERFSPGPVKAELREVLARVGVRSVQRIKRMTETRVEEDFQIEGSDVDVKGVMQEIHTRLGARREQAEEQGLDYDAYAKGRSPLPPNAVLSRDVYDAVGLVQLACDKVNVEMVLTETRLPLVGSLVHRVRRVFHELVLFYVQRLAARQTSFNQQTALALNAIVREMEAEAMRNHTHIAEREGSQDQVDLQP